MSKNVLTMTCVFAEASCARVACVFRPWIPLLTLSNRSYPINIMHILYVYVIKNVGMLQGFDSFLRTISMVKMLYGSIMILIWTEDGFLNGQAVLVQGNCPLQLFLGVEQTQWILP